MTHLTETLALSDDQIPKVRKIVEKQILAKEAARKKMQEQRKIAHQELKTVLTPEQIEKLKLMHKKRHKGLRSRKEKIEE